MKNSFITLTLLAAIAFLSACAKHVPEDSVAPEDRWMFDETLPVPIQFSAEDLYSLETKGAPIENATDLATIKFRVYAFDDHIYGEAPELDPDNIMYIDYEANNMLKPSGDKRVLLKSWAQASAGKVQFLNSYSSSPSAKYYPLTSAENRFNYSFYAAYICGDNTTFNSSSVSEVVNITEVITDSEAYLEFPLRPGNGNLSNVDVLFAKAHATPFDDASGKHFGFNGDYIRAARKAGSYDAKLPSFTFQHVSSAIRINIQAADADAAQSFATAGATLNSFKVTPRYSMAHMDMLNNGTLTPVEPIDGTAYNYLSGTSVVPTTTAATYGATLTTDELLYIVPGPRTNFARDNNGRTKFYKAGATDNTVFSRDDADLDVSGYPYSVDGDGNALQVTSPALSFVVSAGGISSTLNVELPAPDEYPTTNGTTTGFEAGKIYTYTLIIKSVEQIEIKVQSSDWGTGSSKEIPIG